MLDHPSDGAPDRNMKSPSQLFNEDWIPELLCGPYVLVERKEVVGIVARFEVLEPRVVGAIRPPDAALSLSFHDVHVVAVLVHGQLCFQCLNPLTGGSLPIGWFPAGGDVEGDASPAQRK